MPQWWVHSPPPANVAQVQIPGSTTISLPQMVDATISNHAFSHRQIIHLRMLLERTTLKPKNLREKLWPRARVTCWQVKNSPGVLKMAVTVYERDTAASTPYVGWVWCWLSPLLQEVILTPCSRFSPLVKSQHLKFQFDQESGRRRTTKWICYL